MWSPWAREITFGPDVKHDLRSISKSIVGLLYGIALDAGQVPAVQTPALRAFADVADLRNPARDAITIEHLLTMTSGLQWSEPLAAYGSLTSDETRLFWTASAHRFLFARDVEAPPGTRFNYNGANTAALAELLAIGTGLDLREQARRDLFEPLGITDWEWIGDLRGRPDRVRRPAPEAARSRQDRTPASRPRPLAWPADRPGAVDRRVAASTRRCRRRAPVRLPMVAGVGHRRERCRPPMGGRVRQRRAAPLRRA